MRLENETLYAVIKTVSSSLDLDRVLHGIVDIATDERPGGQAQFSVWTQSDLPVTRGLREILDAIVADPGADHSIAAMAVRAAVSERHLVRMFGDQVGVTARRFVERARLEAAKDAPRGR